MLKECGLIEKYGSGIKRIRMACIEHGLYEPIFENYQHGFKVIVRKEKSNGGIKSILGFIKANPGIKTNKIANGLNISQRTAERALKILRDEGAVEFRGSRKSGGYFKK